MCFVITFDTTEINIAVKTHELVCLLLTWRREKFRIVSGTALLAVQQTASLKKAGSLYGNRFQSNVLKLITR